MRSPVIWALGAFAFWEASRATPYLTTYGLDTLRDSALWGYGAFTLLVTLFLPRSPWLTQIPKRYAWWMPLFLLWAPIALLVSHAFESVLYVSPLTGASVNLMKAGDAGTHLGGMAAFLLLGLDKDSPGTRRVRHRHAGWATWVAWLIAFGCVAALGRGGAVSAVVAIIVVSVLRPLDAFGKIPLIIGLGATALLTLVALNLDVELGRRDLSATQIAANVGSVVGIEPPQNMRNLDQTREWRLLWWQKIVSYTVHGKYFWSGKGFGIDLARDDGITFNKANRSPHSAHLNLLARSGVPGLTLWIVLQCTFGIVMLRAYVHARRAGREQWARVNLWILAYWAAFLTNASVDVFLEGPPGGIWFWTLLGFGIAVTEVQRGSPLDYTYRQAPRRMHEAAAAS
jgi:O-antigen ligase/polysaccharide polymerase Wzy-like membrane protein